MRFFVQGKYIYLIKFVIYQDVNFLNGIKLNVGPSPIWKKQGWVGLDHKPSRVGSETILGDSDKIKLKSKSCSVIFSSHVIEHIPHYKFEKCLLEFNRVLKKGGAIRILTPDLYRISKAYVEKDKIFFKKLEQEAGGLHRKDLGFGGIAMNLHISSGQDTALFNNQLTEFIGGYAHVYLYDFEMLKILLKRYGFDSITEKNFCESDYDEFREPLHIEGMKSKWENLNQKFYKKHNLINKYNSKKHKYETNFVMTGFDRNPIMSLIVEAKKTRDVKKLNIKDVDNYIYSRSLLDNAEFRKKCKKLSINVGK